MAMTKTELNAIIGIIERLTDARLGSAEGCFPELTDHQRLYINTWVKGPLECLVPGPGPDPKLASRMARK